MLFRDTFASTPANNENMIADANNFNRPPWIRKIVLHENKQNI